MKSSNLAQGRTPSPKHSKNRIRIDAREAMAATKDLESANSILPVEDPEKKPVEGNPLCNEFESSTNLLVTWDGPNDPACPLNWPITTRWSLTLLTSLGGLVTLMSGSMMAPALGVISQDLHISENEANMVVSIFVLAFAFGPMVLGPMTEVFGRRHVWLICSTWYVVWNTVCGFASTKGMLLAGRILSGLGASDEFAVTNPVLGDCWEPEKRGYSFAIATFIPLLGPAIGPILGGVITKKVGWKWVFWVLSIFDAMLVIYAFFFFHETYGQLLLHRKAMKLRKETGHQYHTQWDIHAQPLNIKLKNSLLRPIWMLATQPTIQMMSIFLAYNFGVLYFVLTSFASLWTERYHQPVLLSGVHYLSLVIGYTLASQIGGRVTDAIWKHLKTKANGKTEPEYRDPLMIPGTILLPAGLLWYGWAAEKLAPWIIVDTGAAVFGCGLILSTQAMQQYVMDSYSEYVASASAASQFLRSIFAFAFPLFAPALYARLGYGWGNSTLAFAMLAFGVPGPFLIWGVGGRLRRMGKVKAIGKPFLA